MLKKSWKIQFLYKSNGFDYKCYIKKLDQRIIFVRLRLMLHRWNIKYY